MGNSFCVGDETIELFLALSTCKEDIFLLLLSKGWDFLYSFGSPLSYSYEILCICMLMLLCLWPLLSDDKGETIFNLLVSTKIGRSSFFSNERD